MLSIQQYDRLSNKLGACWGYLFKSMDDGQNSAVSIRRAAVLLLGLLRHCQRLGLDPLAYADIQKRADRLGELLRSEDSEAELMEPTKGLLKAVRLRLRDLKPIKVFRRRLIVVSICVFMLGCVVSAFNIVPPIYREVSDYGLKVTFFSDPEMIDEVGSISKTSIVASDEDYRPRKMNQEAGFTAHWEGYLYVPASGTYRFFSEHTHSLRILVNDELLVENLENVHWRGSGRHSERHFQQGYHKISLTHTVRQNPAHLRLKWVGPNIKANTLVSTPNILKVIKNEDADE